MITLGEVEARSDEPGRHDRGRGLPVAMDVPLPRTAPAMTGVGGRARRAGRAGRRAGAAGARPRSTSTTRSTCPQFLIKRDLIDSATSGRAERARVHGHRGGHLRRPVRRVLRHRHADMTFMVEAMSRAEYDAYIEAARRRRAAARQRRRRLRDDDPRSPRSNHCLRHRRDRGAGRRRTSASSSRTTTRSPTTSASRRQRATVQRRGRATPGESITYQIPAMPAGDYTFSATIHPQP